MKKIISSIIIFCMILTSVSAVTAEAGSMVSSDIYSINNTVMCIYDIPYETTVEELKENIISDTGVNFSVTDIDGEEKTGIIEDGDRLVVEADGGEYEYYLKTYIDGVGYSDSFNYRSYEEYKNIQNATNKTNKAHSYAAEDVSTAEIAEYNGEKVLKMSPNRIKTTAMQYNRYNFIQFNEIPDKAVVEYDIWQNDLSTDCIWAYVNARYSGVADKAETGYALWGSRMGARGTLMRDDAFKARWLSFEGKQLFMEDKRVYHVRQVIDFDGDIETYINGVKAAVTNENLSETVSKSAGNFSGITSIGLGIYMDQNGDWTNNADVYGVMWDNVKVYDPVKYAEYYINLLPEKDAVPDISIIEKIEKVRAVIGDLTENALAEDEISNIDKLTYWEEQVNSANVSSDIYDVDNDNKTIKGIFNGETVAEFLENINQINGYKYEVTGKGDSDEIVTGDILKVTNMFEAVSEFNLTADIDIKVLEYTLEESAISDIPYNTAVEEFLNNIVTAKSTTAVVFRNNVKNTHMLKNGDILKLTLKNGDEKSYSLTVKAGSSTATLTGNGDIKVDGVNNVISGMEKGISVTELLAALNVSDEGTVKIYSKYGEELQNEKLNGTEIVKVFPQDPQPANEIDIYTLSCNKTLILGDTIVVTIEDEGFSFTGTQFKSGSAVEAGYNGITTSYIHEGNGYFTPTITEAGEYDVYIYTSYHSSNKPYPAKITYNGGEKEVTVAQNEASGWKFAGTYDFSEGTSGVVECRNATDGTYARISAVKFEKCGEAKEITEAKAISGDENVILKEGKNDISKENVKFSFTAEAELAAEDIEIVSENGYNTDFSFVSENGVYYVTPKYPLKKNVTYYVMVETDKLSKAYTYVINGEDSAISATADIMFYNNDGSIAMSAGDAESAGADIKLKNTTSENISAKLVICYYSEEGKISSIAMEDITIDADKEMNLSKYIKTYPSSENGKVKVFVWQSNLEPFGSVYYK